MPVAKRDVEHRAIVLGDEKRAIVARLKVREVAVLVQNPGDHADLVGKGKAGGSPLRVGESALCPAVEDLLQQRWILVLHVLEQLICQIRVAAGEERIAGAGQGENVSRAALA